VLLRFFGNTTGDGNTAIGDSALSNNTIGGRQCRLGADGAGTGVTHLAVNVICIGGGVAGDNIDNSCYKISARSTSKRTAPLSGRTPDAVTIKQQRQTWAGQTYLRAGIKTRHQADGHKASEVLFRAQAGGAFRYKQAV